MAPQRASSLGATLRFARALWDGLRLRCPRCHKGRMFPRVFTYHMNERCPHCGLVFEPDVGEMTGGMAINMVLTSILGTALAIYAAVFSHLPTSAVAIALIVGMLLFGLVFHRNARGLWVAVLYGTGSLLPPSGSNVRTRLVPPPIVRPAQPPRTAPAKPAASRVSGK